MKGGVRGRAMRSDQDLQYENIPGSIFISFYFYKWSYLLYCMILELKHYR